MHSMVTEDAEEAPPKTGPGLNISERIVWVIDQDDGEG
jgi:hypothetical protein